MRILLDTHIFLWFLSDDPLLPSAYRAAISDPANEVYLRSASVWEVVIKHAIGKFPCPAPPDEYLPHKRALHDIASLPIDEAAISFLAKLPMLHRDPFDRIIVAQSIQHDLSVATLDDAVRAYSIKLLPP